MPPEWNTRSMVEVPDAFVWGLLHASERPTRPGSAAFSRATLSNNSWLSSGERPGPPRNGLTWAGAAANERMKAASTATKRLADPGRIHLLSVAMASADAWFTLCALVCHGLLGELPTRRLIVLETCERARHDRNS